MGSISISLITVTFNAARTIERCIQSVIDQGYPCLQYIIIDGLSTDGSMAIINKYQQYISHIVSEPDSGIYDAMNKGIAMATGNVVGILNADDYFADNTVLNKVAQAFAQPDIDIIYGDIDYVTMSGKITRKWRPEMYRRSSFNWGWMPPHPSFYIKRELFSVSGAYQMQYGSAADYELMLRFMHKTPVKVHYLNVLMVKMQTGGVSNKSLLNRIKAWHNDLKAMKANGITYPYIAVILKPIRKLLQYIR